MTPQALKRGIADLIDDFCALNKAVEELQEHNAYLESRISETDDCTALRARVARLEDALRFILDECDWEESMSTVCGDNRIGVAARRALEEK